MGSKIVTKLYSLLNKSGDELHNKIISSGIWVSFSNIFFRFLSTIRTVILARLLSPTIFGLIGIVNFIIDGLETFTQTGFTSALIYHQKNLKEMSDVAWTLNIFRGFILTIIIYLSAPLVANFYDQPILDSLIKVISVLFIIKGFRNINVVFFRKNLDFKKIVFLEQSASLIGFVITIVLAFYLRNVWALIWGTISFYLFDNFLSYIIQPIRPRIRFKQDMALSIFNYGIFITGANIISFLTTEADDALVGKVLGMEKLGYYVIAYSLARIPLEIHKVVSKVMFPAYSQVQNQPDRLKNLYLKTLKFVATLSLPSACGLFILASPIIKVIYGEQWMPAVPVVRILSIYGVLWALQAPSLDFFNGIGKPKYNFYGGIARLLTMLVILYHFTYKFGLTGTAITIVLSIISTLILCLFYLSGSGIKLKDFFHSLLDPLIASFFMTIFIYLLKTKINPASLLNLIFFIVVGALINFSGLFFIHYFQGLRSNF